MKILIDMNLSPDWRSFLERHGHQCFHWSEIGDPRADDRVILQWAKANGCVLFTHDLDFGAILAATDAAAPSVIQVRTQDIMPGAIETLVVAVLKEHAGALESGALVVVEELRSRIRVLPMSRDS